MHMYKICFLIPVNCQQVLIAFVIISMLALEDYLEYYLAVCFLLSTRDRKMLVINKM
jgi:hypothetical protein